MHIVWLSWKDITHPQAGGAEVVSNEIRKDLVKHGHSVTLLTARYEGSSASETVDGVRVMRAGNRYSVYLATRKQYRQLAATSPADLVIDEMNTLPFFSALYKNDGSKRILLTWQLARDVWFFQMLFPLSLVGYLLEPLYLRLISKRYTQVLTESESTKTDLQKYGFKKKDISVFQVGMELEPVSKLPQKTGNKILFFGALRPMKRPIDAIKAFEYARDLNPELSLDIAGNDADPYAQKVRQYIARSRHSEAITIHGKVSMLEKNNLMREAKLLLVTSTKEGWGLIATEANSQGTPAIAYDVDGLRDSVQDGKTGSLVPDKDVEEMGREVARLVSDKKSYLRIQTAAWESSKQFSFSASYDDFVSKLGFRL